MEGARVETEEGVYGPGSIIRCSYNHVLPYKIIRRFPHVQPRMSYASFGPASSPTSTAYMPTRCFCNKCHGAIVSKQSKQNHERKQLKTETISEQVQRNCEDSSVQAAAQHGIGSSSLLSPAHLRPPPVVSAPPPGVPGPPGTSEEPGSLTHVLISDSELDIFRNNIYDTDPGIYSGAVDVNPKYIHDHEDEHMCYDDDGFPDEDAPLGNADLGNEGDHSMSHMSLVSDEDHDPFVVEHRQGPVTPADLQEHDIPSHLLVVYTMVTWLHFQFHLPHVACNAMLAFLALLFRFFQPGIVSPFITLPSATRALGIDPRVELLAVCPGCRGVYPSSSSRHVQEECVLCHIPLFLPDQTRQGNHRAIRTPVIKYPYLPLSDQIVSVLKSPGVEALLDEWRTRPRKSGEYGDIFDGRMCRLKLKAPNGSLFFSNRPHKRNGPDNELRIGVNMGVDWYVPYPALYDLNNSGLGFLTFVATSPHPTRRAPLRFRSATYHRNFGVLCYVTHYINNLIF